MDRSRQESLHLHYGWNGSGRNCAICNAVDTLAISGTVFLLRMEHVVIAGFHLKYGWIAS
jgi:hypothetical protein